MYTLNLIPKKTTPVIVSCSEGDQTLRAFQFKIMDGESNWSIDCDSLSMEISNGAIIPGTVEGNTALFDCTTSASARPGTFAGKIEFIKGDKKIHSAEFLFVVERRP